MGRNIVIQAVGGKKVPVEIVHVLELALEVDVTSLDGDRDRILASGEGLTHHGGKTALSETRAVALH